MYVELPGGTRAPGGYIVPCEVLKRSHGLAYVELSSETTDGEELSWRQWVRDEQLLTDEEAEA